ncbi:MAG: hypothetical protein CL912_00950 [Deltaproteobacteria bacterium]|nr:hypothetical protein [Deltaproteobacteria bacterium]
MNHRHQAENAFIRKDHLRDHLREFHGEDIGAAKGEKNARTNEEKKKWQKAQEKWLASRKISPGSWCCAKCLVKMSVARDGWHCTECNLSCEPDRIERRMSMPKPEIKEVDRNEEGYLDSSSAAIPPRHQAPSITCFT